MPEGFDDWPPNVKKYFIDEMRKRIPKPPRPWYKMARPKQLAPDDPRHPLGDGNTSPKAPPGGYRCRWKDEDGVFHDCTGQDDWFLWIMICGRGAGKTMAGSNWILEQALLYPKTRWAVVAPTYDQVQNVCFAANTSGIRAQAQPGEIVDYNKNSMLITLNNGSEIKGFSAETPERIRGYNLAGAWMDEAGSYRDKMIWDEVLAPALRVGAHPRAIVTTTPNSSPLLRDWHREWQKAVREGSPTNIHMTEASFRENTSLPPDQVAYFERKYAGTRLGRQELEGEMLEDFDGALWKHSFIDDARRMESEFFLKTGRLDRDKFTRVVVGFDPAMTSTEDSDEHGIVVAGQGDDGEGYIIADWSARGTVDDAARRAVAAYNEFSADCVVTEANQAGDWLVSGLRAIDPNVPARLVRAQKGKMIRAQPIAMLAEQGRLHHIGYFPKLEDQLCTMTPDANRNQHDDRADAMIWAMTELRGITEGSYMEAYGFLYCNACGHAFRKLYKICPKCGKETAPEPEGSKALRPGSWAAAYLIACKKCGFQYTAREGQCPECNPNPMRYMSQVARMTHAEGSWLQYNQKNWMNRKI